MSSSGTAPVLVKVAACQIPLTVGNSAANLTESVAAIRSAAAAGARVIGLPELTPSGYVFASLDEAKTLAESLDGTTVTTWAGLAAELNVVIVGGICESNGDAKPWNSSVVIDPSGLRAVYHKVHLWGDEPDFFSPGDQPPPVVDTFIGRISTMVCYDLEFPEWIRLAALAGADILVVPTNWPAEPERATPTPMEVVRAQAGAGINRMAIVAADRCMTERGVEWTGGSCVVSPTGHLVAGPTEAAVPAILVATIDLALSRDKRTGARNDALADRRPKLYNMVSAPRPVPS